MRPKLLIIQPSNYRSKTDLTVVKARKRSVVNLTLPYLAALAPKGWDIKLVDELLEDVNYDEPADLVALSTWTQTSYRAYDIAAEFRKRNVTVVGGGPHIHFHSEEASEHFDSVGVGEGEEIWPQMLNDAAAGRLQKIYKTEPLPHLEGFPLPRYDLLNLKPYGLFKSYSVQFSRGCPFKCDFCSERFYLGEAYRTRPSDEVVEEVKHCKSKLIFFADSNFGGKPSAAMELMEKLIPLKVRWSTLWTSNLCMDKRYLDLAVRSGLLHINIGIESIDPGTLGGMNKKFNQVRLYREMFDNLRSRGISFSLNFIFGWDGESADVFRSTLDFLTEEKVPVAYFNILTPDKGTPLYDRMKAEDRIINVEEVGRFSGQSVQIKPQGYTGDELQEGVNSMYQEFYSLRSMLSRLSAPVTTARMASWSMNFTQRKMAQSGLSENNFESY